MATITFITPDERRHEVDAPLGLSIMQISKVHPFALEAACGGALSCATCHIHVDDDFFKRVGAPVDDEEDMLEFSENRQPTSRLGCQIDVTEELDGLIVQVAGEEM